MSDSAVTANLDVRIPLAADLKQYFFDNAVVGETERFRRLDRFEAHYLTTQYQHQPYDWWGLPADAAETVSPSVQVPLGFTQPVLTLLARQKRPTAPYHLAKAIVDRFTGLLFSEARKPDVEVEGDPDTDDFLHAAMEQSRFWARWREARAVGGATGSVLVTAHLRKGRFVIQCHNPKNVQVMWKDRRALEPLAVLIIYRYPQEEIVSDPKTGETRTRIVDYLYRRIITDQDDTVYKPVKLEPGANLAWDVESAAEHGLGVFPGVWVQNKPVVEQEDGDPDCQGAWQSFDTIDRLLAQMNKALLLNLDPTLVLKIDPKELLALGGAVRKGSDNALNVGTGDAKYLEMVASGVEAGHKLCDRLKQNVLDVTRCVLVDPEKLSGSAQSAKAMEYVYAPMLEQADEFRSQWGDNGVIPMLRLMELMARKFHGVKAVQNGKAVILQLDLPKKADGTVRKLGPGGWIRLKWGPYFAATENDKQMQVANIVAAKTGEIIDEETAVNAGAPIFGVQDAAAMLAKIQDAHQKQLAMGMGPEYGGENEPPPPPPAPDANEPPGPPAGQGGKP
jgi:hypothetical protein